MVLISISANALLDMVEIVASLTLMNVKIARASIMANAPI